ncbi:MAG: phosphopantothenoylcysteine decarboxylase [Anaerovoracaceae bacterium]
MKRILITGGPTNEYIDEVMKITNMSTGSFSIALANEFLDNGYEVCLILNRGVSTHKLKDDPKLKIVPVETTDDMLYEIKEESQINSYDALIHAAAVGDYKADFTFLMEDLAEEIFGNIEEIDSPQDIYDILVNPKCKIDNSSKISSYQSDLTVKLALTPKIIKNLREWFPDTLIIGCKLLENVSKDELISVAQKLCVKNSVNYIMANDLADLRNGLMTRYLVSKDGYTNINLEDANAVVKIVNDNLQEKEC